MTKYNWCDKKRKRFSYSNAQLNKMHVLSRDSRVAGLKKISKYTAVSINSKTCTFKHDNERSCKVNITGSAWNKWNDCFRPNPE